MAKKKMKSKLDYETGINLLTFPDGTEYELKVYRALNVDKEVAKELWDEMDDAGKDCVGYGCRQKCVDAHSSFKGEGKDKAVLIDGSFTKFYVDRDITVTRVVGPRAPTLSLSQFDGFIQMQEDMLKIEGMSDKQKKQIQTHINDTKKLRAKAISDWEKKTGKTYEG
jgi:hypothetical protein